MWLQCLYPWIWESGQTGNALVQCSGDILKSKSNFNKSVTKDIFFFKCKESWWLKVYRFIWIIENKILKKKHFPAKICLVEALFLPLVKAKNQLQNFGKHLKQKRCEIKCLNVPNFWYYKKKKKILKAEKVLPPSRFWR